MSIIKRITNVLANLYRKLSYRRKLTLALLIIACFISVYMSISSYRLASSAIYDISRRMSDNNINAVLGLLTRHFDTAHDQLTQLLRQPAVQDLVGRRNIAASEYKQWDEPIKKALRDALYPDISRDTVTFRIANLYFKNGYSYALYDQNPLPFSDYEEALHYFTEKGYLAQQGYNAITWCEHITVTDNFGALKNAILGVRLLYDGATAQQQGIMVFAIDEDEIFNLYSGFSEKALLMQKNGKILSGTQKTLLGQYMPDEKLRENILLAPTNVTSLNYKDGDQPLVSFRRLAGNHIYFVLPFDYYRSLQWGETRDFALGSVLLALIGMAIGIASAFLLSRELAASVLSLKNVVRRVYDGDLTARFTSESTDEIAYLGGRINDMLDSVNGLFEIQDQDAAIKRDLELRLLQSQINPHLLYNTLDSVVWAVRRNDVPRTEQLLESLSGFFKGSLSGGNSLVPLETELNTIGHYLRIQQLARSKDFQLVCDIPPLLMDYPVVKLSLQPIVENAIIHGFSGYRDEGDIAISAKISEGELLICVRDNGIGIMPQDLAQLNQFLNTYPPPPGIKHFGLYNVNRRIHSTFGPSYGLSLDSEVGHFTTATIRMPYNKAL